MRFKLSNPVSEINGISKKRARKLADLRIYSIKHFIDATKFKEDKQRIAASIGISTKKINDILIYLTEDSIKIGTRSTLYRFISGISVIILSAVLVLLSYSVLSGNFITHVYSNWNIHLYEHHDDSDYWDTKHKASCVIKTDWNGFSNVYIEFSTKFELSQFDVVNAFPYGFMVNRHFMYNFKKASAELKQVYHKTVPDPEDPLRYNISVLDKEVTAPVKLLLEHEGKLVDSCEDCLIFKYVVNADTLKPKFSLNKRGPSHSILTTKIEFVSKEPLSNFGVLTKGVVNGLVSFNFHEYELIEISDYESDWKIMEHVHKGQKRIKEEKRRFQLFEQSLRWIPGFRGRFITPERSLGAKIFYNYEESSDTIYTSYAMKEFSYIKDEIIWIPFFSAIMIVPLFYWGIKLLNIKGVR